MVALSLQSWLESNIFWKPMRHFLLTQPPPGCILVQLLIRSNLMLLHQHVLHMLFLEKKRETKRLRRLAIYKGKLGVDPCFPVLDMAGLEWSWVLYGSAYAILYQSAYVVSGSVLCSLFYSALQAVAVAIMHILQRTWFYLTYLCITRS